MEVYDFTIPMALMDYVPVALFLATMVLLQQDLYGKMCRAAFTLFAAGTVNVFFAGFLKATWKLLYAAGICDFAVFNAMFLPLQALGFLLTGAGLIAMLAKCRTKTAVLAAAPALCKGSFLFIGFMVAGLACLCTVLSILAAKLKKKGLIALFVLSFVCYMGMGYLSSRDSASAAINWIEQSINCVGQALLLWGVLVMHKAGLKELNL